MALGKARVRLSFVGVGGDGGGGGGGGGGDSCRVAVVVMAVVMAVVVVGGGNSSCDGGSGGGGGIQPRHPYPASAGSALVFVNTPRGLASPTLHPASGPVLALRGPGFILSCCRRRP